MSDRASRLAAALVLAAAVSWPQAGPIAPAAAQRLPKGYLPERESRAILQKTVEIRLDPDLSHLGLEESLAVGILLEAGGRIQELYEKSRHCAAPEAFRELARLHEKLGRPAATANLMDLYRLYDGPSGRGLDNKRIVILPVDARPPGGCLYEWGVERKEIDAFLAERPSEKARILHPRTVVRRSTADNLKADLARFDAHAGLFSVLHPGLDAELRDLLSKRSSGEAVPEFYAVPYAIAFADELLAVRDLLARAAAAVEKADPDLADYLRHRGLDLLTNDYEAGDAAWVRGEFGNLNFQVGSYETYDDELYGTKSFFGASVLVRNRVKTSTVQAAITRLQDFEDSLPYEPHRKVRDDVPVGVYDVIADFGQARGTNTATILPNESHITRKYGRTILIRDNILSDPDLFAMRKSAFEAAVEEELHGHYQPQGDFFRTLWHEIGHYLGPDATDGGQTFDLALQEDAPTLEELKADLIALFVAKRLFKNHYYGQPTHLALQAAGVRRVLLKNRPAKSQVYATMELMQMNYFLEKGLFSFDRKTKRLRVDHAQLHPVVESMLREVLSLQKSGDKKAADRFIEKYSSWDRSVHEAIASAMKKAETYRYVLVRYAALGE